MSLCKFYGQIVGSCSSLSSKITTSFLLGSVILYMGHSDGANDDVVSDCLSSGLLSPAAEIEE